MKLRKVPFSLQLDVDSFLPASPEDKEYMVQMRPSSTFFKDGVKRLLKNKVATVSFIIIVIIVLASIILPMLWPYQYDTQLGVSFGKPVDPSYNNLAPFEYGTTEQERIAAGEKIFPHIFGTDAAGRDYFIRVVYGTRISLSVGFFASIIVLVIGLIVGSISGYVGGKVDLIIMRIVDIFNCIPTLPILLIASAVLDSWAVKEIISPDQRIYFLMAILTLFSWSGVARLVRGQILALREQEYMTATEVMGLSTWRKIFVHLIPNVMPQLIVSMTLGLGSVILYESTLSYLGLGVQPPHAAWGTMIASADKIEVLNYHVNMWLPAGIMIVIAVLGFNFVGDGLRDAMDPKSKK